MADWTSRHVKPAAMQYNSCFYTLTLTATPSGAVCWDQNGVVHQYDHHTGKFNELKLSGDQLPGAYVDNSSIVYDSKRDRVLMLNTLGYQKPFDGQVWELDLKTKVVKGLSPAGKEQADRLNTIDKSCYDAANDLLLIGTFLKDGPEHTRTPAYDCANNRWVSVDIAYQTATHGGRIIRNFPNTRSDGILFDPQRQLIWGTDTHSQVYVLRLELPADGSGLIPLQ